MRKIKFLFSLLMVMTMALYFTACSEDDPVDPDTPVNPEPTPEPDPDPETANYHFDIFMTIGEHAAGTRG